MLEAQADAAFGATAKRFYDTHRTLVITAVPSLVGIASGTGGAAAVLQGFSPLHAAAIAAAVLLAGLVSLLQTRHWGLAALTALAPVPGLLWAAPLSGGSDFGAIPLTAYALGFSFAAITTDAYLSRQLDGTKSIYPWRAGGAAFALSIVLAVIWFRDSADAALQAVADEGLAIASVVALLPVAFDLIHLDEAFVARANRAQERRRRFWDVMARITIPRWALSFTGIAIVMLALGWYGAGPVLRPGVLPKAISVIVVVVGAGLFARGWRESLAAGLVMAMSALLALWAMAVAAHGALAPLGVLQVTTVAIFIGFYGARRAMLFARDGDPPVIAQRRMLELAGGPALAGAGAIVALLPALAVWSGSASLLVGMCVAVGAGLMLVPAAATALEVLLPRRHSVEELYGKRRKPAR